MRRVLGERRKTELFECNCGAFCDFSGTQTAPAQGERDVFLHGRHHNLVIWIGKNEAHQAANFASAPRDVEAVDCHSSAGRCDEPVDHSHQRRLAGSVGTNNADAVLRQAQTDVAQHASLAKSMRHSVEGDCAHPLAIRPTRLPRPAP